MDERKPFQFSLGNLMLMMVPLAAVFWLASLAGSALDWKIWAACLFIGIAPAIGALVGGWQGMKVGLGLIVVGQFWVLSLASGAVWEVWLGAVIVGVGPAVGALVGGCKGMGRVVLWIVVVGVCSPAVLFLAYVLFAYYMAK